MHTDQFATLDSNQLDDVTGGNAGAVLRAGGRLAGKLAWPVTAGLAAYDAYQGYSAARQRGAGVGESIKEGGLEALDGATFGLSNWALGRRR